MTGHIPPRPGLDLRRRGRFMQYLLGLHGIDASWIMKAKKFRFDVRFALSKKWLSGAGLEIGAGSHPLKTSEDTSTIYLDYAPKHVIAKHFNIDEADVLADLIGSMDDIPSEDCSYDFVAASHVLEHLEDPIRGLRESLRVLRDDGILFIVVPNRKTSEFDFNREVLNLDHFKEEHHNKTTLEENKINHYHEFVEKTQISMNDNPVLFNERLNEFIESDRRIHFHSYGPRLVIELLNYSATLDDTKLSLLDNHYFDWSNEIILVLRKKTGPHVPINADLIIRNQKQSMMELLEFVRKIEDPQKLKAFYKDIEVKWG